MLDYTDYFSASYDQARRKFRNAVTAAGGASMFHRHTDALGANGEDLTIDVGHVGNPYGSRQLVMISATHGLEGFAGSALQVAWLEQLAGKVLANDVGVLLVHGLNPYGFSHGSRTTANGVDLNRNFIDHAVLPQANPRYAQLQPWLLPRQWNQEHLTTCEQGIAKFRLRHGDDVYFDTFVGGQWGSATGPCFGGHAPEWEHLVLRAIVAKRAGHASKVAVIDWHTGIGEYGKPFPLIFARPGSEAQRLTSTWWGDDDRSEARPHGRRKPAYQGLVFQGVETFLPNAQVAGGVIEFGTRGPVAGDLAIRQDLWLRHHGHLLDEDTRQQLQADLQDSLSPISGQWREQVLEHGLPLIRATLEGLMRW